MQAVFYRSSGASQLSIATCYTRSQEKAIIWRTAPDEAGCGPWSWHHLQLAPFWKPGPPAPSRQQSRSSTIRLSDQGWVLKVRPVGSQSRNLTAEGIKRLVCMKGPTAENVSKDFKRVFPSLEAEGLIELGSASLSRLQQITCGCLDHFW